MPRCAINARSMCDVKFRQNYQLAPQAALWRARFFPLDPKVVKVDKKWTSYEDTNLASSIKNVLEFEMFSFYRTIKELGSALICYGELF